MSGGETNTTITHPGQDWHMLWGNGDGWKNFQLDIVGFLAILGESAVTANAQVSALSRLFYLPRLLPAPQALLPPSRPSQLPTEKAWVTGVESGNHKEHLHHIANVLLGDEKPDKYEVRCFEITKKEPKAINSWDIIFRGLSKDGSDSNNDSEKLKAPPVKARATGPLTWVTLIGFFLSVSLFIISIVCGDGYSLIATILLSLLSSLIGVANKWELELAKRKGPAPTRGDTVIRFPIGSFVVVRCTEEIARELYFAPEEIKYSIRKQGPSRLIALVGTLILMLGIIFLANAKLELQFAWAGAYIIINAAHWIAAAMPPTWHWDTSGYEVVEQSMASGPNKDNFTTENDNFTQALWKAIVLTKDVRWVQINGAAPKADAWDKWLKRAEQKSKLARCRHVILDDPNDPEKHDPESHKHTIWDVPEWDAKAEWDQIKRDEDANGDLGGDPGELRRR